MEKELAEIFGALSSSTRIKILLFLGKANRPVAFAEIEKFLQKTPGDIHYHLKLLLRKGLIVKKAEVIPTEKGKRKRTLYELTEKGKIAIIIFLEFAKKKGFKPLFLFPLS